MGSFPPTAEAGEEKKPKKCGKMLNQFSLQIAHFVNVDICEASLTIAPPPPMPHFAGLASICIHIYKA